MRNNVIPNPWLHLSFLGTCLLALQLLVTGCQKNERIPTPQEENLSSLNAAKKLVVQTQSPLLLPDFSKDQAASRSKSKTYNRNLTPRWDEAICTQTNRVIRYEIPLTTSEPLRAFAVGGKATNIVSVLVVEMQKGGKNSRIFVATLIGEQPAGSFSYTCQKNNFTGIMIISSLSGDFLAGYAFSKGYRQQVWLTTSGTKARIIDRYRIATASLQTKAMGNPDIVYQFCDNCFSIEPFKGDICMTCQCINLDEIVVTGDYECPEHGWGACPCKEKCPDCHQWPCMCGIGGWGNTENEQGGAWARCPHCLQVYCPSDGHCMPEPPPGEESEGGGGSGGYSDWNRDVVQRLNLVTVKNITDEIAVENIQLVLETNNNYLNSWFTEFVNRDIKINIQSVSDSNKPIAYSEHSINNGLNGDTPYTISLNSGFFALSNHAQMTVLLHEFAHLYVYGQLSLANGRVQGLGTVNPELLTQLNRYGLNRGAHEYFATYKLDEISEILYQAMQPYSGNEEMLKWGSLTETEAFKQLAPETQEEIKNYLGQLEI